MPLISLMQQHTIFLSYETAYLKTYYPAEFMAALTLVMGNNDKVVIYEGM